MPTVFSNVEARTYGDVTPQIPINRYLDAAWDQGQHDSALGSLNRIKELAVEDQGPILQPDELNVKYKLPGLHFDKETPDSQAEIIYERKRAELQRNYYLGYGDKGLFSLRGVAAFGTQMISSFSNPIDFGSMFIPVVGEEAMAEKILGTGIGAASRRAMARGFVTRETIQKIMPYAPKFGEAVVGNTIQQAGFESLNLLASSQDKANYTLSNAIENVIGAGVFAGALHMTLGKAFELMKNMSRESKVEAVKKALSDFAKGEDIKVDAFVNIDENILREKVKFNESEARTQVEQSLKMEDIRAAVKEKYGENIVASAVKSPDGSVDTAMFHSLAKGGVEAEQGVEGYVRGFVTDKGRFVPDYEAREMAGLPKEDIGLDSTDLIAETHLPADSKDIPNPDIRQIVDQGRSSGKSDPEIMKEIKQTRLDRADAYFFNRPEIQELIKRERERAVDAEVQKARENWDEQGRFEKEKMAEIQRQQAEGKILRPEEIEKHTHSDVPDDSDIESVKKDVESLKKDLKVQEEERKEVDRIDQVLTRAIDALKPGGKSLSDPFLIEALGKPLLRLVLQSIRAAYRQLRDLDVAIKQALKENGVTKDLDTVHAALKNELMVKDPDQFVFTIQSELNKPLPFNVKSERFTPNVIISKIQQLPAPERELLLESGVGDFLKKWKATEVVPLEEFRKFVESKLPKMEIRPMLNVAETGVSGQSLQSVQHELETLGYKIVGDTQSSYSIVGPQPKPEKIRELENQYSKLLRGAHRKGTKVREDQLVGNFVSQNVSVPIPFEKMEKPRTVFLAASGKTKLRSSHYGDVKFPKKSMLAWAETHVVTLQDGRRVLHAFEVQSDVRQQFFVDTDSTQGDGGFTAWFLNEEGKLTDAEFSTQKEAQSFVDQKLDEFMRKNQPLIKHTDEVLLKALVKMAQREGLDGVVISDPRTAMLTQGHLGEIGREMEGGFGGEKFGYEPPSQAEGMTQAYGNKLPGIMKKITGSEGEHVEMGPEKHYNYGQEGGPEAFDMDTDSLGGFNKAFPGSDSPSGKLFPIDKIDPNKSFELFTPKQVEPVKVTPHPEAMESALNCLLSYL